MGRIKTIAIKNLGKELIRDHPKKFTEDFDKNKQILGEVREIKFKKTRNTVAGYITNEMKKIKRSGI